MSSVLIVTREKETAGKLQSELSGRGFTCLLAGIHDKVVERIIREGPELVLLEINGRASEELLHELVSGSKIKRKTPVITLISSEGLSQVDAFSGADDFLIKPWEGRELALRARRALEKYNRREEVIRCGDLAIDTANCEVRVEGKIVELTFKEYELLKFLAQDRGRVFTREALLNKVWGYDYFGGDRTVDVHVRRLRSKVELSGQIFIETVRNIGYRFKKK
jgi:two-component system alkaline phosphatase synthesis response regulator PhoP